MMSHTVKLSMIVVGAVMTAGLSLAHAEDNNMTFCRAIGLAQEVRESCAADMSSAISPEDKDKVAAAWVAKSPIASNSPSSLYNPPTDSNAKNGIPGTPYQDKINVPNEVSAQINRAVKIDHLDTVDRRGSY